MGSAVYPNEQLVTTPKSGDTLYLIAVQHTNIIYYFEWVQWEVEHGIG